MKTFSFRVKTAISGGLWTATVVAFVLTAVNCSSTKGMVRKGVDDADKQAVVSFLAGASYGGLVENREMIDIDGVAGIDAITGATRMRYSAGVHSEITVKGHTVETGLDYLAFDQSVEYDMPSFAVNGKRDVRFHQLRAPLTYNWHFFHNSSGQPGLALKAGLSIGYTFSKSATDVGRLADYKFVDWDYGLTLGVAVFPLQLDDCRVGISFDLYRGSRIYEDVFHTAEGMGGQSYVKFGIVIVVL